MPFNRLSTTKIAKAVGCHPNTVRLYEQIGFISPVERSPKGYRLYTEEHLDQMRLGRLAMGGVWPGPNIRHSSVAVVRTTATRDYSAALESAYRHLSVVRLELEMAETAATFLENWAEGKLSDISEQPLHISAAAHLLGLTCDILRNWEHSGLIDVPRNAANHYRLYHSQEIGRLRIIRMLRQSGYSLMAILRMLVQLDQGQTRDLRAALDTPREDEDLYRAADRWLSTLRSQEQCALQMIEQVETMSRRYSASM